MPERQQGDTYLIEEQQHQEGAHPLLIWTGLTIGDVVSIRGLGIQDCVGTVDSRTSDGLIIWIRNDLNERRVFHFHECHFVRVLNGKR